MLRQAAAAGTTDIVASPHANTEYAFDPLVVERMIGQLQAAVGDVPRIHYGCDFHLTLDNIEDALRSPGKYSIDPRGYLLVEFSNFLIPKTTDQVFAQMMQVGLRPIVTHPERNQLLQRRLPQHFDGFLQTLGPIVQPGQDVAVDIDHGGTRRG